MAQNIPFLFGAAGGQSAPIPPAQQQQNASNIAQQSNGTAPPAQAQQAAFQQNAQLPGIDLSALAGISPEQLALIGQLFQSGALRLPPIPAAPPQPIPTAPATATAPSAARVTAQPDAQLPKQDDVDMDKEEGELEEGEELDTGKERDFLRPPPTGPRKRSASPHDPYGRAQTDRRASFQDQRASEQPAKTRRISEQPMPSSGGKQGVSSPTMPQPAVHGARNGRREVDASDAAKQFVLQMHKAGYTYDQLAKEIPNHKALRSMYQSLNLPIPSAPAVPQMDGTAPPPRQLSQRNGMAMAQKPPVAIETRKASETKKPVPASAPAPVNRAEYLARLAALKNKPATTAATPEITKAKAIAEPKPAAPMIPKPAEQPQPALTRAVPEQKPATPTSAVPIAQQQPSSGPPAVPSTIKTDLIRERLAKLKAEQAAKALAAQSSSDAAVASSPLSKAMNTAINAAVAAGFTPSADLGSGIGEVATKVPSSTQQPAQIPVPTPSKVAPAPPVQPAPPPIQTSFPPVPPTPSRPYSALPGLFMGGMPPQPSPVVQQPKPSIPPPPPVSKPAPPTVPPPQAIASFANAQTLMGSPASSPAQLNVERKRPAAAETNNGPLGTAAQSLAKRPTFGPSRSNSESERLIIDVSDDEDEEDVDVDPTPMPSMSNGTSAQQKPVGPLSNFPPKPPFSTPGTPTPMTPSAAEHAAKVKAHDTALAALQRKIAEKEALKAKTKAAGKASAPSSGISTPMVQPAMFETAAVPLAVDTATTNGTQQATMQPMSAAAVARQKELAYYMQRQKELAEVLNRHNGASGGLSTSANEPAMSGEVPNIGQPDAQPAPAGSVEAVQEGPDVNDTAADADEMDVSSAEEVELTDDNTELLEQAQEIVDIEGVDEVVDSQATTVGTSQPPTAGNGHDATEPTEDQLRDAVDDVATPVSVHANAQGVPQPVGDENDQMEESSNEDEDEYEPEDLDAPTMGPVTLATLSTPAAATSQVVHAEDESSVDDSSSASSTRDSVEDEDEEEEYEPELVNSDHATAHEASANGVEGHESELVKPATATGSMDAATDLKKVAGAISDVTDSTQVVGTVGKPSVDDDLAPELQPSKEQQITIPNQEPLEKTSYYKPYESALVIFKDYRYHPDYLNNVRGGYKSMTYSHRIHIEKMLCPFEAAGGKCNDKGCEHQHFQNMGLTDTLLLQVLGTHRTPTHGPEDEKRWKEGLSALVKQLRSTNMGKDANAIATRIAQFRREFVGDATKVLNLG